MKTSMLIAVGALLFGGVGGYLIGNGGDDSNPEGDSPIGVRTKKSVSSRVATVTAGSGNSAPRAARSQEDCVRFCPILVRQVGL